MAQINRSTWDTTYNQSASGSFKNNSTQAIIEATMRAFSKDAEDSLAFLSDANVFTVSNNTAINITGNTTSNNIIDFAVTRSGVASSTVGFGANIEFFNSTSGKRTLMQSFDDNIQFFNFNGSWTERMRIDSNGIVTIGTTMGSNIGDPGGYITTAEMGAIASKFTTSDTTDFHISAIFDAEQITNATTHSIQALEGSVTVSAPNTSALALATIGNFFLNTTGTVTAAHSGHFGGNTRAAGTITEWDGLWVGFVNSGSATITNATGLFINTFPSGVTNKYAIINAETTAKSGFGVTAPTAIVDLIGSSTSIASMRIRSGTAPTSPNDGEMWYDGTNVKFRVGGTTKTFTLT